MPNILIILNILNNISLSARIGRSRPESPNKLNSGSKHESCNATIHRLKRKDAILSLEFA